MNPRIKNLLLKVSPMAGEDGEHLPSLHTPQEIERFTELVVKECIRYCSDNLSKTVGGALKMHFGIQDLTAEEWEPRIPLWEEKE